MKNKISAEKLGDILDHVGKRSLICLCIAAVGLAISLIPFMVVIGAPLVYFGVYGMLSVIPKKKIYVIDSIDLTDGSGESIPCVLIKQKHYAYMPIVPIVCPFYYFSFKTQYYILRNVTAEKREKPRRVHIALVISGVLEPEKLTHSEFKALAENNVNPEIYERIKASDENAKTQYSSDIRPFVDSGLLTEVFTNGRLSVCKIGEGSYVLCHYSKGGEGQNGLVITKEFMECLKNDDSEILEAYIANPRVFANKVCLSTNTLERLMNAPEFKSHVSAEGEKKVREEIEKDKKPITREMIIEGLRKKLISNKKFWGFFWAAWCIFFVPIGFLGGIITILMFSIACGAFCGYMSYTYFKEHINNKKALEGGRFTVVKAACTDIEDRSDADSNYIVHKFENGETIGNASSVCCIGDYYYFVYPEGHKIAGLYYPALEYTPAPDIAVTSYK